MDGSSVTDLGQFWARRGIELYMCSNTGLSGWAEFLEIALVFVFIRYIIRHIVPVR